MRRVSTRGGAFSVLNVALLLINLWGLIVLFGPSLFKPQKETTAAATTTVHQHTHYHTHNHYGSSGSLQERQQLEGAAAASAEAQVEKAVSQGALAQEHPILASLEASPHAPPAAQLQSQPAAPHVEAAHGFPKTVIHEPNLSPLHFSRSASEWPERIARWARYRSAIAGGVLHPLPNSVLLPNSQSQYLEDIFMWKHFFFQRGNGTFLEMGALDGRKFSNTLGLELDAGWRGVLVEGDPENYQKMTFNRPNQVLVNAAGCRERQKVHYVSSGMGAVRGIWEFMSEDFKKSFHRQPGEVNITNETKMTFVHDLKKTEITCVPMNDIFSRYGIQHFNLWSLDVEGAELEILRTVDFDRWSFDVIMIEAHPTAPEKNQAVRGFMHSLRKFVLYGHVVPGHNDFWLSTSFVPSKASEPRGPWRLFRNVSKVPPVDDPQMLAWNKFMRYNRTVGAQWLHPFPKAQAPPSR